jgi:DNA-binding transcriptional LysR family regulator
MSIELRQLRHFVMVAEELHFARAAAKLHMTQPPLSQSIQAFEQELGCQLFTRTTRSIALTPAGLALLPEARRLLQQALALPQLVQRAAAGETGQISIAFVSIADYSILPPLLRDFRTRHSQVKIELQEATSDVQISALEKSGLDAGLLIPPIPERLQADLHYKKILTEPLCLAIPDHALKSATEINLYDYQDAPLIIFPRRIAPAFHDSILRYFHEQDLTPIIGQEAIQMQTIIGLVSAGMGIALVPQSVSNLKRKGVRYLNLPDNCPKVELGVAWRKDNPSPTLQAFLNQLPIQP